MRTLRRPPRVRVAEHVEPVIHVHHHHVATRGEAGAVVHRVRAGAREEAAAVAPEHHRASRGVESRRVDRDVEAVFGFQAARLAADGGNSGAGRSGSSRGRVWIDLGCDKCLLLLAHSDHGVTGFGGMKRPAPAGRCAVGHAEEFESAGFGALAADFAAGCFDDRIAGRGRAGLSGAESALLPMAAAAVSTARTDRRSTRFSPVSMTHPPR